MNDKEKLRQKLLEQTFKRSTDLSSINSDLESILKKQEESINELSKNISDTTLKQINEEMKKDFGVTIIDENNSIESLDSIKEELIQYYYSGMIDLLIDYIKKAKTLNLKEYSLFIYNYKDIKELLEVYINCLFEHRFIKFSNISYVDFSGYGTNSDIFYQDMYHALYSDSSFVIFNHIEELPISCIQPLTNLLEDKEMALSSRYVDVKGTLKQTGNQLVKEAISSLKWKNKYLIFLCDEDIKDFTNKVGMPFIKAIDEIEEFIDLNDSEKKEYVSSKVNKYKFKDNNIIINYCLNEKYDDLDDLLIDINKNLYEVQEKYHDYSLDYKEHQLYYIENNNEHLLFETNNMDFEEIDKQLQNLVGLEEVKKYLKDLKQYYQVLNKRKSQGKKTMEVSKHMIFTGNPGTGKTTVARILAQYLKAANILTSGHLIEVTRKDLVGQYVGHTAAITSKVISSALQGVLFIDEAYSLYRGQNDSYGLEAIDTLVKAMEDHRDELVVVLAGYDKEMQEFLKANSGLRSRFSNIIEFKDYTGEELYKIACNIAIGKDYRIDDNCKEKLVVYFDKVNSIQGGNGRLARTVVEKAMIASASRNSDDDLLLIEDFDLGSDINE